MALYGHFGELHLQGGLKMEVPEAPFTLKHGIFRHTPFAIGSMNQKYYGKKNPK